MGKSSGKRTVNTGLYWCNIYLSDNKPKLCVAELIDGENMIFRLWSNCFTRMTNESTWKQVSNKPGWWFKDFFEEDVNEFFYFN